MENIQIDPQNLQQMLAYELIANTNSSFFSQDVQEPARPPFYATFRRWLTSSL